MITCCSVNAGLAVWIDAVLVHAQTTIWLALCPTGSLTSLMKNSAPPVGSGVLSPNTGCAGEMLCHGASSDGTGEPGKGTPLMGSPVSNRTSVVLLPVTNCSFESP